MELSLLAYDVTAVCTGSSNELVDAAGVGTGVGARAAGPADSAKPEHQLHVDYYSTLWICCVVLNILLSAPATPDK
jgi:hypothetical protein